MTLASANVAMREEFAALSDEMLAFLFTLWDEAQQAKGERSDIPLLLARAEEAYRTPQWPQTTMVGNVREMLAHVGAHHRSSNGSTG